MDLRISHLKNETWKHLKMRWILIAFVIILGYTEHTELERTSHSSIKEQQLVQYKLELKVDEVNKYKHFFIISFLYNCILHRFFSL